MRAISAFSLLAGMSTRRCFAVTALRMRESMSEIGSVIFVSLSSIPNPRSQIPNPNTSQILWIWVLGFGSWDLPTALRHARDVTFQRQFPEAQAAHRELPHVSARPPAQPATVAQANPVLRWLGFLCNFCGRRHSFVPLLASGFPLRASRLLA